MSAPESDVYPTTNNERDKIVMTNMQSSTGSDDFMHALTAPGAPFEMRTVDVHGHPCRVFCNGPQNLGDVYRIAATYAERTMIVCDGRHMSYAEILGKAAALGQFLKRNARGQDMRGQRMAIVMSNRPEWMISFIAVTAMGATAVLVNSRGTATEISESLDDTFTTVVIADERRAQLMGDGDGSRSMIVVRDTESGSATRDGWVEFSDATQGWEKTTLEPPVMQLDDEAIVMFTSGTTGRSKAALFTQRAVLTGLMHIQLAGALISPHIVARRGAKAFGESSAQQSASLLAFPLFHVSGCYAVFLASLLRGAKIVLLTKWDAATALELIEQEQVAAFAGAPAMYWDMLRLDRNGDKLKSLLSVGAGGQVFPPKLLQDIAMAFPYAVLGIGYGMTECGGTVCAVAGEDLGSRLTASGRVFPSVDIKIVDELDVEVPIGETGEILISGAMLMREYCQREEATAEVMRGGWLRSGDIGRLDAEGYLHVVDRKKNIVISGGENISCSEVECALIEHASVEDAAAFSVPDDRLGEKLVIAVVLREGAQVSEQSLKTHLGARLAAYKIPQCFVFSEGLPRNASGKVLRHELRRQLLAQVADALKVGPYIGH